MQLAEADSFNPYVLRLAFSAAPWR